MRQNSTKPLGQRINESLFPDFNTAAQWVTLRTPGKTTAGVKSADITRRVRAFALPQTVSTNTMQLEGNQNVADSPPYDFLFPAGTDVKPNDIVDAYDGWTWKMLQPSASPLGGIGLLVQTSGVRMRRAS